MLPAASQANRMNQADQKTGDANVGTNTEVGAGDKKEQQPRTAEKQLFWLELASKKSLCQLKSQTLS